MTKYLAESDNFKVTSEYENVILHFKNEHRTPVDVGSFYGDPECAIISGDEKYLVVAGCGLIVYKLREPFSSFGEERNIIQYVELYNAPENIWWVKTLYQDSEDNDWQYFRFVAANDEGEFIYRMNVEDFSVEKITPHPKGAAGIEN